MIGYEDLLGVFWASHSPTRRAWSAQYKSAVFAHDPAQRAAAEKSLAAEMRRHDTQIHTEIIEAPKFYRAEDYHQKHRLRGSARWVRAFDGVYASERDFIDSTAAMRVNALLAGYLKPEALAAEFAGLDGLTPASRARLLRELSD